MPFPPTNPALARALAARGYDDPTPVQAAVLQAGAEARDLLVSAQTGSGKTVAFGLALAPTLLGGDERMRPAATPLALIVAPTRELAMQVRRELDWLYAETGARVVSCIGGMDGRAEARALHAGCHIVVGTPGRLCDHLARGSLNLSELRAVVLDEADEMLDMGFRDELEQLLAATPEARRTLLFSATIAPEIAGLARQFQTDALRIDTRPANRQHADIEYRAVRIAAHEAGHAVVNVLRYYEAPAALVFCATREGVRHMQAALTERGFATVALSGELTQNERTRALQSLRDGQARVCVATDVAARGLDLPELALVIHADLPVDRETLLHRSGRTGRAGRKGTSVLIVASNRYRRAEALLRAAGVNATWSGPPPAEAIRAQDDDRLLADPVLDAAAEPEDAALAARLLADRTPEQIAAALVRLYRARLPAPEDLSDPMPSRAPRDSAPHAPAGRVALPPRPSGEAMAWFSLNIGRQAKADPKWLVPLICRVGGVTKREIGAIRIFDRETKFEIRADLAEAFAAALAANPDKELRIHPATAPAPAQRPPFERGGPRQAGPFKPRASQRRRAAG